MDMSPSKERNIDQRKLRKAKSQVSNIIYPLNIYIYVIFQNNFFAILMLEISQRITWLNSV